MLSTFNTYYSLTIVSTKPYTLFHCSASAFLLSMLVDLNLQAICSLHCFSRESTIGVVPQPASHNTSVSYSACIFSSSCLNILIVLFKVNFMACFFLVFGLDHSDQISLSHQHLWKSPLFPKTCIFKTKE